MSEAILRGEFPALITTVYACGCPLRPLSDWYFVRLLEPAKESTGGIALVGEENWTDAEVLAAGPGAEVEVGIPSWTGIMRSTMWAAPGDRVQFPQGALRLLDADRERRAGFVRDRSIVSVRPGPDWSELHPANGGVVIRPDPVPKHVGVILLPDDARRRPHSGIVLAVGPGELRMHGPLAGVRVPVARLLGADVLIGRRVWWDPSEYVETGEEAAIDRVIVPAAGILAVEE